MSTVVTMSVSFTLPAVNETDNVFDARSSSCRPAGPNTPRRLSGIRATFTTWTNLTVSRSADALTVRPTIRRRTPHWIQRGHQDDRVQEDADGSGSTGVKAVNSSL